MATEVTILPEPAEADSAAAVADRDLIERGLRRLTVAPQTIFVLTYYVGQSPTETADGLELISQPQFWQTKSSPSFMWMPLSPWVVCVISMPPTLGPLAPEWHRAV